MKIQIACLPALLFLALHGNSHAQRTIVVDKASEKVNLEDSMFVLEDSQKTLNISDILESGWQQQFKKPGWLKLNFGLSRSNYWMKFELKNASPAPLSFYLRTGTALIDSLYLYKVNNGRISEVKLNGEAIPFTDREVKHRLIVFPISLQPGETAAYYLMTAGNGQPISIPATLLNEAAFHRQSENEHLLLGLLYGSIVLILLVNASFYIMTWEKVYLFFSLQTIFSWLSTVYYDGFIKEYIIGSSAYWINEFVAIALCLSYIFACLFTIEFLNLRELAKSVIRFYYYLIAALLATLAISFIHPTGFSLFILLIIVCTSPLASLMFISVIKVKKKGYRPFQSALWPTVFLIFFGSLFQLNIAGIIPDNIITHHGIHFVTSQALLLTMGISIRFKYIKEDRELVQQKLITTLNEYSQTLIASIEVERQRLASELHDSLGQTLLVIRNRLLLNTKKDLPKKQKEYFLSLADTTSEALDEVRAISQNLRPAILDTFGLSASVRTLTDNVQASSHLKVCWEIDDAVNNLIRKDLQINVYRIIQEAFSNIIKHAGATGASIKLLARSGIVTLCIADNGTGFDPDKKSEGLGLVGIRERVKLMNGTFSISRGAEEETVLTITIPHS